MQEVIIYRNPLEAAMWRSFEGASVFPVACGVVVFFAVFLLLADHITERRPFRKQRHETNVALLVSAAVGVFVTYLMWI